MVAVRWEVEKRRLGGAEVWVWLFWKIQGALRRCHPLRCVQMRRVVAIRSDGPFTPLEHGHEAQHEAMSVHSAAAYPTVNLLLLCCRWGRS